MHSLNVARAKCYLILQGLECSIADNLLRSCGVREKDFLRPGEQGVALARLRDDLGDESWGIEDLSTGDLLVYLDIGTLLHVLNRHSATLPDVSVEDIRTASQIIDERGVLGIRRRVMHPVRPLEGDDLSVLLSVAEDLPRLSRSLDWRQLIDGIKAANAPGEVFDVDIPLFWAEDPGLDHNLPVAEFDDTGFVGREEERRALRKLLDSDHSVVTVVGAGGIGKTALALRVCNDILEEPVKSRYFERIVWVSLKTKYLTADGVKEITEAVDSSDLLVNRLLNSIGVDPVNEHELNWDRIVEQMKANRTLLVIDNLDTLGDAIRDLAVGMPRESKLLLTSRIGLGEIELRYAMGPLSARDATVFMRHLGTAYNYDNIRQLEAAVVRRYCRRLHFNPLLIKWFVQAVGRGTSPGDVFSQSDLVEALHFCWENVYDKLDSLSTHLISTLLAARRGLSRAELQELLSIGELEFLGAMQRLHQANIIESPLSKDGTRRYRIGSLVLDYLTRLHPPASSEVKRIRDKMREWQSETERNAVRQNTYRYDRKAVNIVTDDERIAAPKLRNAIYATRDRRFEDAGLLVERARELAPEWWEVYRVKAQLLDAMGQPLYDVEEAFEDSVNHDDNDINRYHYGVFLMKNDENARALEQIEKALTFDEKYVPTLRSVKGLTLLRMGQITEALVELEFVWNEIDEKLPKNIRLMQGTQLADAHHRRCEQFYALGDRDAAMSHVLEGIGIAKKSAESWGWDPKLVDVCFKLLGDVAGRHDCVDGLDPALDELMSKLDGDAGFGKYCAERVYVRGTFERFPHLASLMPRSRDVVFESGFAERIRGTVFSVSDRYGFIECELATNVHMNRSSMIESHKWDELEIGQDVMFIVENRETGPHALRVDVV